MIELQTSCMQCSYILAKIRLDKDEWFLSFVFCLSSSSSEDVFKTFWSSRIYSPYSYVFRRHLQDVFKTSWSRSIFSSWPYVFKMSSKRFKDVFKTSSIHLWDVLQKCFQGLFKTYHQVKLFFYTSLRDVTAKIVI